MIIINLVPLLGCTRYADLANIKFQDYLFYFRFLKKCTHDYNSERILNANKHASKKDYYFKIQKSMARSI